MNKKLRKAIRNNNDLYEIVFKAQNIRFHRNESIWYCLEKTPPLYSNLVTVAPDWKPEEIFAAIDEKFEKENWNEWSIKDSFGKLDLSAYKFKKLFDARWFYLAVENFEPVESMAKLNYRIIDSEKDLSQWRIAWDANESLGQKIFPAQTLNDPNAFFIAGSDDEGKIVCGCLVNKTEDVLGISNFFVSQNVFECWSSMIEFTFNSIAFADIVGYARHDLFTKLKPLGFEAVGDLIVWLRQKLTNTNQPK